MAWGDGCARRITRSIESWGRRSLTAEDGQRDGGRDGGMGAVINAVFGNEVVIRWGFD